jgi:hypothetical protein
MAPSPQPVTEFVSKLINSKKSKKIFCKILLDDPDVPPAFEFVSKLINSKKSKKIFCKILLDDPEGTPLLRGNDEVAICGFETNSFVGMTRSVVWVLRQAPKQVNSGLQPKGFQTHNRAAVKLF